MTGKERTIAILRWVLPVVVVGGGVAIMAVMVRSKKLPQSEGRGPPPRLVRTMEAHREVITLRVRSYGTVRPKTVTNLVAQVGGEVIAVSPALAGGGFFQKDDLLVRIDPTDYEIAIVQSEAGLAQARQALALEEREAKLAIAEWKRVMGEVAPDPLVAREPQLAAARANLAAAEASVRKAKLDLDRTRITAPYAGRTSRKLVDVGQVLMPGQPLAVIHDTSRAEVSLSLHDAQLAHLELPSDLGHRQAPGPRAKLRATFAGRKLEWNGRVVRIEDEVDPRTRMVRLVVAVDDPYARRDETSQSPLPFGVFVEVEIEGQRRAGVVALPREAMRGAGSVYVVDGENRLKTKTVKVLKTERERVLLADGLDDGEHVCLSPIETFLEGMPVARQDPEPEPKER